MSKENRIYLVRGEKFDIEISRAKALHLMESPLFSYKISGRTIVFRELGVTRL